MPDPGIDMTLKEPSAVRFAVIVLALLAMILGPISGPPTAHGQPPVGVAPVAAAGTDCAHGIHEIAAKTGSRHQHCMDIGDPCTDTNGCRYPACFTGGPVPAMALQARHVAPVVVPFDAVDRVDGLDIAPPIHPPRRRV